MNDACPDLDDNCTISVAMTPVLHGADMTSSLTMRGLRRFAGVVRFSQMSAPRLLVCYYSDWLAGNLA